MRRASRRRSARSIRQSFTSSTAARSRFPRCSSSFASKREKRAKASAADPAKPVRIESRWIFRIFRAPCLKTTFWTVTWPSPARAIFPSRRTARMVVLLMSGSRDMIGGSLADQYCLQARTRYHSAMLRGERFTRRGAPAVALLLCALALNVPGFAIHAGHIQGRVLDESGRPLPGAVVTISGDGAVGIWHCAADETGFYRIAGLPASTELKLKVEADDRATFQRDGYAVRDDQTLHLNVRLRPKGIFSTLVITDPRVPYHKTALAGARETLPAGVRVFEATERTPEIRRRLYRALASRPDGILAIGSIAARLARETIFDTPVVY